MVRRALWWGADRMSAVAGGTPALQKGIGKGEGRGVGW